MRPMIGKRRRTAPRCQRCGRVVPLRRRATSDYCTDKCARDQQRDDDASQASERADVEAFVGYDEVPNG